VDKYRRLDPPGRLVEVRYRGTWLRGLLKAYWREDGRWQAYVEFSHLNGVTQPKVFDQDDVQSSGQESSPVDE